MHHLECQLSPEPDTQRLAELDALVTEIGKTDPETLIELRRFLLNAMFPCMPEPARAIMQPVFTLLTLEIRAIDQSRSRLGAVTASPRAPRLPAVCANSNSSPTHA